MIVLVLALFSAAFAPISYIQAVNWLSIVGFVFGIAAWVMARKIRQTDPSANTARICGIAMVIGIIFTFVNLVGIVYSFVWGNLMSGGMVVF